MSDERDEWVRVESEDDVGAGMTLRISNPSEKTVYDIVLAVYDADPCGDGCTSRLGFGMAAFPPDAPAWCIQCAMRKGDIVYRLRSLPAGEMSTVATKRRVSVKAGR